MVEKELDLTREEAISAYIDKPGSEDFYINAFARYEVDGVERFQWVWSWWAMFGGVFFLLYRKLYLEAVVFFLLSMAASSVVFAGLVLWVVSGGIFTYFVYKRYKKIIISAAHNEIKGELAIESLSELGGYNQWAVYIAVTLNVIFMGAFVYMATQVANDPNILNRFLENIR